MTSGTDPLPAPEGAADKMRLGVCQSLLNWTYENVEDWTSGGKLDRADLILITIFARSARTYEAVVRWLGERGFGEQGLMLNRSLFEDMIDAHWVSMNRELAVERLEQHDLYSRLLRADTQRKFPKHFDQPPPKIVVSNAERKELRRLFKKSGSGSWTGVPGLEDRVHSVLSRWEDPAEQERLLFWTAWVVKLSNEVLHPSAFSIGRLGSPEITEHAGGERFGWHFGSTQAWLEQALHGAFFTFGQLIGLMIEDYEPSAAPELVERLTSGDQTFRRAQFWDETGLMQEPPPG